MDFEAELKKAYESFQAVVKDTVIEGYSGMLGFHINEMEKYAGNCQFGAIAQHMRELGEESKGLDAIIDGLKKTKAITDKKEDEILSKHVDVWDKIDLFIASELVENCSCKLRGINY